MRGFNGNKTLYVLVSCHSSLLKTRLLSPTSFLGLHRAPSDSEQRLQLFLQSAIRSWLPLSMALSSSVLEMVSPISVTLYLPLLHSGETFKKVSFCVAQLNSHHIKQPTNQRTNQPTNQKTLDTFLHLEVPKSLKFDWQMSTRYSFTATVNRNFADDVD